MSNLCPQCGSDNRALARFCAECGAALVRIDLAAPNVVLAPSMASNAASTSLGAANGVEPEVIVVATDETGEQPDVDSILAFYADPAAPAGADAEPPTGALVAGRYVILDDATDAAGRQMLTVEDHGVCRACEAVLEPLDEEPFCTNCGAQWQLLAAPWPIYRLVEDAAPGEGEQHITWAERTFVVLAAEDAPEGTAAEVLAGQAEEADAGGWAARRPYLLAGQRSDVGVGRAGRSNEDSLYALTATIESAAFGGPTLGLYVVADGMGGHLDGEVASRTACAVIGETLLRSLDFPALPEAQPDAVTVESAIRAAIEAANRRIVALAAANDSNMGTTVVLALAHGAQVYLANAGDSRAYHWGRDGLRQVTVDHSHVFKLMTKGVITEDELYLHPRRNEIYRSLGTAEAVAIDHFREELRPGEVLLLCSDGLWEMLRNAGIADVLELNLGDPQVICDELVRRANLAGGDDNISVIVVRAVG